MKMKSVLYNIIFLVVLPFIGPYSAYSEMLFQDKSRTRLKAYYGKNTEDNKVISVNLISGSGATLSGIPGAEVDIFSVSKEEELKLASLITDADGNAQLIIEKGYQLPRDENGYANISIKYGGNDSLRSVTKEIEFLDLDVALTFEAEDSLRYVVVKTTWTDPEGNTENVGDIDVNLGVERLYSILPIEESTTGDDGIAKFLFPGNIPGDSLGWVKVGIKIDDRKFGIITRSAKIDWGTSVDYTLPKNGRTLYGEQAPVWMIIAVSLILVVVWISFILAIRKVYKIKGLEPNERKVQVAN